MLLLLTQPDCQAKTMNYKLAKVSLDLQQPNSTLLPFQYLLYLMQYHPLA